MPIKRIWFVNEPTASIDSLQRSQIGIGYPFPFTTDDGLSYLRRYLNDPLERVSSIGPEVSYVVVAESDLSEYYRRYLNDTVSRSESIYMWISPTAAPDGIINGFTFTTRPVWCSFNGLNQFENEGYTVVAAGANFVVTFKDVNGTIITPASDDAIRAQVL